MSDPTEATPVPAAGDQPREQCPVCGSDDLADIRCKTICRNCRTILRSCSDL
jgi:hypothetical protein